ncbi:unnamed protein product [Rhodiola kirilowii]
MAQVENLSSDQVNEPAAKIKNGAGAGASAGFLKVKRLSEKAFLPIRLPNNSAYVLLSAIETKIPGRGMAVVQTDISIAIPEGSYARIGKGSEFPCKEGIIEVGVRVIERDYRGPIEVTLFNHSAEDFEVKQGSRVGQLILDNVAPTTFPEVVEVEYLDETVVDGWCRISGIKLGREVKELLEQVLIDHPEGGTECLKWVLLGWNMRGDQNLIEVKTHFDKAVEELVGTNLSLQKRLDDYSSELLSDIRGGQNYVADRLDGLFESIGRMRYESNDRPDGRLNLRDMFDF